MSSPIVKLVTVGLGLLGEAASMAVARREETTPSVSVKNGSYTGVYSSSFDQDFFLGIPYAKPPKRFTLAESLDTSWNDAHEATAYSPHCFGYGSDQIGYEQSEDCLYLNVVRPAGIDDTSGLPVAVWIHGGGLYMGGSGDRRYNLSFIVERSVEMNTPVIGVSLNYRLSAFGFLCGQEATDDGSVNIGFHDQRLALRWVNENIAAFGGSPDKVTIFGESSGAESVSAQVLAYNGRDDGLFRGAIAESGFGGALYRYPGGFNATGDMQATYDELVGNVSSCASLVGSPESLGCLRQAPFDEINYALNVSQVGPWPPVLDHDFIYDYPANQMSNGKFPRIPLLIGCNTDEGTGFGSGRGPNGGGVNTDEEMRNAIAAIIPADVADYSRKSQSQLVDELMELYPNNQSVGIPSLETWPYIIQPNDSYAQALGAQYRRTSAFFGDFMFQFLRRRASKAWAAHGVPNYVYRFNVVVNGQTEISGASHFQEVAFVFLNLNGDGYAVNPFGGNGTYPEKAKALSKTMSSAWISFFADLDPNGKQGLESGGEWPVYTVPEGVDAGHGIVFNIDSVAVELDEYRDEGMSWMTEHALTVFGD